MKQLIVFFSVLLLSSCNSDKSFFDFDEAILYSMRTADEMPFKGLKNLNEEERQYTYLVYDYHGYPSSILDKNIIPRVEKFYSIKKEISQQKLIKLDSIFRQRDFHSGETTVCEPIFRDIIIFKKQGKLIGVAKICFSCSKHYIIGSKNETANFGESGEFIGLKKLLKE